MSEGNLVLDHELSLAKARARRRLSQRLSLYKAKLLPLGEGGGGLQEWTGMAYSPAEALAKAQLIYGTGATLVQLWLDVTEGVLRPKRSFPRRRKA